MNIEEQAYCNVKNIIEKNYQIPIGTQILLVYDTQCALASILMNAYKKAIDGYHHKTIDFNTVSEAFMVETFNALPLRSLVILVQSFSFRMTKHRLRADLFQKGHMVIEHARLSFNTDDQIENYIASLTYDTPYYVEMSGIIEKLLEENKPLRIESGNNLTLTIEPPFEKIIKNTGDFSANSVASSGFPIGEVFTEAKNFTGMNGSVVVFGFPTEEHKTYFAEPFTVTIEHGFVVHHNGPAKFEEMLNLIRSEDSQARIHVREIGFGLNRGLGFHSRISEPTSFERFCGMHFSLGLKHDMYRKKMDKKILQKFHIDIFCKIDRVFVGDVKVFENGTYCI